MVLKVTVYDLVYCGTAPYLGFAVTVYFFTD